ncbi:MAG: hypothetical protein AB7Q17_08755 [Phycisphaerae bacterium]
MLLREQSDDQVELRVSLSQLKKIYLALFRQLHQSTPANFDDFDEDDMLSTVQNYLQRRAAVAGVDGTDHAQWDAFLGVVDAPSCEQRMSRRRPPD